MKNINYLLIVVFSTLCMSCVTMKEVRYNQPSESLVVNEEGLVPYNIQPYRVTKNDILKLNIVTTPKGDAAQFYSSLNAPANGTAGGAVGGAASNQMSSSQGSSGSTAGNTHFYFNGLKVDSNGEINIMGIGFVKAEGRTLAEITKEIQEKVNENFMEGKSQVRLDTDGITYYIVGDVETVGITGEKVAHKNTLNIFEALSINGGLNRTVDRKIVEIHRKYPEGIKIVKLDLTRQDVMNSPYYWIQNGDEIYLNTRGKNLNGFGKDSVQTLTTGVSLLTTVMSIYLILTRL